MTCPATRCKAHSRPVCLLVSVVLGTFFLCSAADVAEGEKSKDAFAPATAERLVDEARQAKLDGDTTRYFSLLRKAIQVAPDFQLARWQLGQMQIDGKWLSVEEAQRRAAANPKQAQYRELRKAHGESPEGQLALARWCRKNDLHEEARFHWASVLSVDPANEEALRAVDMRWSSGRLLTRKEIIQQKKQLRESKRAIQEWKPTIAKWQRAMSSGDAAKRNEALKEIRALTSIDAIPAIEAITLGRDAGEKKHAKDCADITLAFLEALARIKEQAATESLVRHTIYAATPEERASAIEKLRPRPAHDYVPLLLSGLAMPIESSFAVHTSGDGSVHYRHSLYREGPDFDWEFDTRLSAVQNDLGGRHYTYDVATKTVEVGPPNGARPTEVAKKANVTSRYLNRYSNVAAATELQVWQSNLITEALNMLIMQALAGATGQNLATPKAWWDWWQEHNEYYASDEHPVNRKYYSDTDNYYYGQPSYGVRRPRPPRPAGASQSRVVVGNPYRGVIRFPTSCFATGTPVWTKTGQRPIESLELGELVLAQDVDTGELAYKPVIGRTVRPPTEILKLSFGSEALRTTRGHPLWVAGVGWRMAKELGDGAILHGVTGSPRVTALESSGQEEAYNLVVADFNTYFVGESGILVHDNTPRKPTRATVPGLAAK